MTDLKAPPQNEWLARAAALLRSGRDTANSVTLPHITRALPVIGALLNSGKLGDMAFGRSPEGVEQMSYGEAPITLPTLAKPMGFPKNEEGGLRALDQLEGLGMMPMASPLTAGAKGGTALATMLPYIKGTKGVAGHQTPVFEKAAAEAVRLLRKGKTASEVGQETGMWVIPRGGNRHTLSNMDPDNAMFMTEISDDAMRFKPEFTGTAGSFAHGTWPLPDVLEHPELFKNAPHLNKLRVNFNPKLAAAGSYNFPAGTIRLNPYTAGTDQELLGTLGHEIQHSGQYHTNDLTKYAQSMPGGGSPDQWKALGAGGTDSVASDVLSSLGLVGPGAPREIRGLDRFLRDYLKGIDDPNAGYRRLLGEQQAEATRFRIPLTAAERLEKPPYADYTMGNPFKGNPGLETRDVDKAHSLFEAEPFINGEDYIYDLMKILRTKTEPPK